MKTKPIAWTAVEDALISWVRGSTGFGEDQVRLVAQRDLGSARGPAPKCQIALLSMLQLGQAGQRRYRQVQRQRYTVTSDGPGIAGVDFFPGLSLVPQTIAYMSAPGEAPADIAAGLLVELQANLPAGYTAIADPEDTASVLVDGSTAAPVFAALPLAAGELPDPAAPITSVADAVPNVADLLIVLFRCVWRLDFRSEAVNGSSQATNAMMNCITLRKELLDPTMRSLGFSSENTAATTMAITPDRVESVAVYDAAFRGRMTVAVARTVGRAIGIDISTQLAA